MRISCSASPAAAPDAVFLRFERSSHRRPEVVRIFPKRTPSSRLVGAVLLEQNDDWLTQNRYMQIEGMTEMASSAIDAQPLQITPKAA